MVKEVVDNQEDEQRVVLTPPMALELSAGQQAPNILQCIFSLFKNVRPGSDLTHFQLPPLFNMPKSQLQCYGETVYCIGEDYLSRCSRGESSLERFISVVAWSISTTRPLIFGQTPFNPILGETHHVSRGSLNVLLEQVSHHPPVSALHATDAEEKIELIWCQQPVPRFYGSGVEAVIKGKRLLKLLKYDENYEMDSPNLSIKFLPAPGATWSGNITITCQESELEAELCFNKSTSFFGLGGSSRSIKGKIYNSRSLKPIYEIYGQWDRIVSLKDVVSGEIRVLYDANNAIAKLSTPALKDPKGLWSTESSVVWGEVSKAILNKDWDRARETKRCVEERERKLQKERTSRGEVWIPKYFAVSHTKEGVWECWPTQRSVPAAPIVAPFL